MEKELCVTTDFMDDLLLAERVCDKEHLDAMMAYCAALGATRHEWVLDTIWGVYESYPGGFDLLEAACDAAHRHGMRFDVVFKPFEGGMSHPRFVLPHSFPRPASVPLLEAPGGLIHAVRPFVAAHPEMRLARRLGGDDTGGRIETIRLVKGDDAPAPFGSEQLSIWTSPANGGAPFTRYRGPIRFNESIEWRPRFPYTDRPCRLLTLAGLELPDDARFIRVRCEEAATAEFTNEIDKLIELVDERGHVIPSTHSPGPCDGPALLELSRKLLNLGISRYLNSPEVRELIDHRERFLASCQDMYSFEHGGPTHRTLDREGELVVMRGKPQHAIGALSPVYPEVREQWLQSVQFCIDRGVDGVNIRLDAHNRPSEPWAYGFNEPVLALMEHEGNTAEASRINGDGYTQFLRDARDLLHGAGREIGVHLNAMIFQWDDRHGKPVGGLPHNIEWQWETWVAELADYVEFRGSFVLRPDNRDRVIDRIGLATRKAGIPFIFQSVRGHGVMHFEGPFPSLAREMTWARQHPDITSYNLYELANFSRVSAAGKFEGSRDIAEPINRAWAGREAVVR